MSHTVQLPRGTNLIRSPVQAVPGPFSFTTGATPASAMRGTSPSRPQSANSGSIRQSPLRSGISPTQIESSLRGTTKSAFDAQLTSTAHRSSPVAARDLLASTVRSPSAYSESKMRDMAQSLHAMDHDLENHSLARQQRQAQLQSVADDVDTILSWKRTAESNLNSHSEGIASNTSALNGLRATVEQVTRNSTMMIDERAKLLLQRVDADRSERDEMMSGLQQQISLLKERNQKLSADLDEERRVRSDVMVPRITNLEREFAALVAKVDGPDKHQEIPNQIKALQSTISQLQLALEREKSMREADTDKVTRTMNQRIEDLRSDVAGHLAEAANTSLQTARELRTELSDLKDALTREAHTRDAADSDAARRLPAGLDQLRQEMATALESASNVTSSRLRDTDDRIWKLSAGIDREVEARERDLHGVAEALGIEKQQREAAVDSLAQILQRLQDKVRASLDAPLTVSASPTRSLRG
eukprot:TRINITY_DN9481_c0_g1_i1.p1 TRINITY_DN9481_c0_g1~~TRINITY_DN9481_c0_g1_i1.p1  ORF type:complete len:474 (+),score=113.13 TRINITY_DN9481_c0_g1_i1:77-1498(+)